MKNSKKLIYQLFLYLIFTMSICEKTISQTNIERYDALTVDSSYSVLSSYQIHNLSNLCQIWGFLKYYHPAVYSGKYDWDNELLKMIPVVLRARDRKSANMAMEKWVDRLGKINPCKNGPTVPRESIKLFPDYGTIFDRDNLSPSLIKKIEFIKDNYNAPDSQYYVVLGDAITKHAVNLTNERTYLEDKFDSGKNLLALFRFWSTIQYFYPYRNLLDVPWLSSLNIMIPIFFRVKDEKEYIKACQRLAADIDDSHSMVDFRTRRYKFESLHPLKRAPFQVKFIENKLVVTGYYLDTLGISRTVQKGDIINSINNVSVDSLVKYQLPYITGSNPDVKYRNMSKWDVNFLRGNGDSLLLCLKRNGSMVTTTVPLFYDYLLNANDSYNKMDFNFDKGRPLFKRVTDSIGYVYPYNISDSALLCLIDSIKKISKLIIDLRVYSDRNLVTIPYFIDSINSGVPYLWNFRATLRFPGTIVYTHTFPLKGKKVNAKNRQVVLIVNSETQSRGEYIGAYFQNLPNCVTVGSRTAGASGSLNSIELPYGIAIDYTDNGKNSIDKKEWQRVGIKVDIPMRPTIQGIKEGRDELLEKAVQVLTNTKEWDEYYHFQQKYIPCKKDLR